MHLLYKIYKFILIIRNYNEKGDYRDKSPDLS